MKITQEADYSIRIVCFLYSKNNTVDAKKISSEVKVPIRFTLKILRRLVLSGLIESRKGIYGGYKSVLPANQVSVADIVEAVDGPIIINKCFDKGYICSKNGDELNRLKCSIRIELAKVNKIICEKLKEITIEKLIMVNDDNNNEKSREI